VTFNLSIYAAFLRVEINIALSCCREEKHPSGIL